MSAGDEQDCEAAGPAYVYESKVHCANVLLSLEEQRRMGILCDVTVLVEGREIRAHRAILAASSRYFLQALLGYNGAPGEPIINLPDKVTAKGFAPLLQFAYTAKLALSRENIHEVTICADFLGVHNLEDSCFRFLQAQLQNDSQLTSTGKVEYNNTANNIVFYERTCIDNSTVSKKHTSNVTTSKPLPSDLPQCDNYFNYHYQHSYRHQHNTKTHDGDNNDSGGDERDNHIISANHRSASPVSSQLTVCSDVTQALVSPSKIKEEPVIEEKGDEQHGCNPDLSTEEVLEMELEVEGVPVAVEHSSSRGSPSSCLRSYLQRGGLNLSSMSSTAIEQLLSNRLFLNHYRQLVNDRQKDKRKAIVNLNLKSSTEGVPAALTNINMPKASSSKHERELDRRSVIFSSAVSDEKYGDEKFSEKMQQFDFSKSPHSGCYSGLAQCRASRVELEDFHSREIVFSQDCTKVKSDQELGASGGNSSDESESFSEGDSESGIRVSGPEKTHGFSSNLHEHVI